MAHTCHATGCGTPVPPMMWGCKKHWYMVPKSIRDRVWANYRQGQCDDQNPSRDYLLAARVAVIEVATIEGIVPDTSLYDAFLLRLCTCESMEENCPKCNSGPHSDEWWDGTGPCRCCGIPTCPACDPETGEHP